MATKPVSAPVYKTAGSSSAAKAESKTKRSVVTYKSDKPIDNLSQLLAKTEDTILELSRMLSETEDSTHLGVGGMPKLTVKQMALKNELDQARRRYDMIMNKIENS